MAPTPAESLRRKRLLIDPMFQGVFALYAVISTIVLVPIFIAANFYFFNLFVAKARSLGLGDDHELFAFVDRQRSLIVVVFFAGTLLAIFINVVASYIFSNRIAGAMYRLRTEMAQARDWRSAQRIVPRKLDFFKDVTEAYNQLLERSDS